jgi:TolB-like protein
MKKTMLLLFFSAALCLGAVAKDNLAILPFAGGAEGEGETIAELFSFEPALTGMFSPIPRTSINRAIRNEQRFQMTSGMTDPDTIADLGKQLGAQYVVAGNITKLGNRNLLIISILKIDELRQIAGDIQTYARVEEIKDKLPAMARNIITAAQVDSSRFEKLSVVPLERGGNIDSGVADTLAQILSVYIIRSGKYRVYPRTATLEQVQAEYKTQLSGDTAEKNLVDMGKGDNPRFVLSIAARRLGNLNMFNASIINLESGVQVTGESENYNTLDDGIQVMEKLARQLAGGPVNYNTPGDETRDMENLARELTGKARAFPSGGGTRKTTQKSGGAVFGYGVLNLGLGLGSFIQGDWAGGLTLLGGYGAAAGLIIWELSLSYEDPIAGIPGGIGLGVAGVTAVYGFIRPMLYNKNRALAEIADGINISVAPGIRGGEAVRLSYTVKF